MLASPKFIFRVERDPAGVGAGSVYRLDDIDLASRLSFFLWSSIPDDELLDAAGPGICTTPAVLRAGSPHARRSASRGARRQFRGSVAAGAQSADATPDKNDFPDFDDNLRQAFERELELFFGSIVREDRSVLDLLTADYTFLNERLAQHYGIPNVYGSQFRRVVARR